MDTKSDLNNNETTNLSETLETVNLPSMNQVSKDTNFIWPLLSVDDMNISFKVVGELPTGCKLKVVNDTHLAAEDSILGSLSRYNSGDGRKRIISFLDHFI